MVDTLIKLKDIAVHMDLEPAEETAVIPQRIAPCGEPLPPKKQPDKKQSLGIHQAVVSVGKPIPLLKTMLTTACERNCYYCPFRAGRSYKRQTFKPEEMAQTFMDMHRAGMVKGLFLSSGIIGGGVKTQDKLLKTAVLLRNKHQFRGYLHLKLMPGVEKAQVARAMQLASRLSVNLEAPNEKRLPDLAPKKFFFEELLQPLQWAEEIRQTEAARYAWNGRLASTVTQFVVGGTDETDLEILSTTHYLLNQLRLRRTYFSAFSPIRDTPLENRPAENPLRQHRLYQASFLFRDYAFDLEEMPFSQKGNLPLEIGPKRAWAQEHLQQQPLELNRAVREELLRVPGVGPKSADIILKARRQGTLKELHHLRQLGVRTSPLAPFVLLDGKRPSFQLPLL